MYSKIVTEAMAYIVNSKRNSTNIKGVLNKLSLLKILFFAERHHIRNNGKFFSNAKFYIMKNGSMHSQAYDILKGINNEYFKELLYINGDTIVSCKKIKEYKWLSKDTIESLEFALKHFGELDSNKLIERTHLYPEYIKHEKEILKNPNTSIPVCIDDFFLNSKDNEDPYKGIVSKELLEINHMVANGTFYK